MLAEFLKALSEQACAASLPALLAHDAEPEHVYYLATGTGVERKEAEPAPRDHKVGDLDALAKYVKDHGESFPDDSPVVWYCRTGVIAVLDDHTRRDRASLPLSFSPQVGTLQGLERATYKKQQDIIKTLRISLHGCRFSSDLLAVVRNLRFNQKSEASGAIGHQKASLGKTIEQEVTGAAALPEFVDLDVPIFHNLPLPLSRVRCAVDLDLASESLALIPLPGELERAVQEAEARVGAKLGELLPEVLVVYGSP